MQDIETIFKNIATKGKIDIAQVKAEFTEISLKLPDTPDRDRLALRELNNKYSGPPDNTEKMQVCIIGVMQLGDFSAKSIKAAQDLYKSNPETALTRKMVEIVKGEVIVLDIQQTVDFKQGKGQQPNPNIGKPLGHSYNRNTIVLAKLKDDTEWQLSTLALRGEFAWTSMPFMYKNLDCNLLGDISGGLKTARTTQFKESSDGIDFNAELTKLAQDKVISLASALDEAKKWTKDMAGFYDRFSIVEGEVKFMNDPKKPGDSFNGKIDSFETNKMITCFVDDVLGKLIVGEEYTFIVQCGIGKGYDQKTKKQTDEPVPMLNVLGAYQP